MKVCIISGSPRKNSNSLKLARAIAQYISSANDITSTIISFEDYDIPLIPQGKLDPENLTPFQQNLKTAMAEARLVFIISPEYNWMPSAELVNFLHLMADKPYADMWNEKVFAIAGVSNGRGGRFPTVQLTYVLNKIIGFMNFDSLVSPRVFESQFTQNSIDHEGTSMGNEEYDKGLEIYINYALKVVNRWN